MIDADTQVYSTETGARINPWKRIAELERELAAVTLARDQLWGQYNEAEAGRGMALVELAQAQQDAERYRWLRDNEDVRRPIAIFFDSTKYSAEVNTAEETDAAIDAAMKETT